MVPAPALDGNRAADSGTVGSDGFDDANTRWSATGGTVLLVPSPTPCSVSDGSWPVGACACPCGLLSGEPTPSALHGVGNGVTTDRVDSGATDDDSDTK